MTCCRMFGAWEALGGPFLASVGRVERPSGLPALSPPFCRVDALLSSSLALKHGRSVFIGPKNMVVEAGRGELIISNFGPT